MYLSRREQIAGLRFDTSAQLADELKIVVIVVFENANFVAAQHKRTIGAQAFREQHQMYTMSVAEKQNNRRLPVPNG